MNVQNLSAVPVSVVVSWSDGTPVTVWLVPGAQVSCFGADPGSGFVYDSFTTNYMVVVDQAGSIGVHGLLAPAPVFMHGFFWAAPLTALLAAIWFIRRSMSVKTGGYSSE